MSVVSELSYVTGVFPDRRVPGQVVVEVDGARFASLPQPVVNDLQLVTGIQLSPERLAALTQAADTEAAHNVALRTLAVRGRSTYELKRRLREKGHSSRSIDVVVTRLESSGLLDDREYSVHFAEVRSGRGFGPARLSADLQRRGVARPVAEAAVQEALDRTAFDVMETARALVRKRWRTVETLSPAAQRRRLSGYLRRRGFNLSLIRDVLDEFVSR
jgi:regulatory protein